MCTLAFISFLKCLYLCILFLLLQPKAAQNEPVPLGAMLTKGALREIYLRSLGPWRSMNSKWRPMLKREVIRLVINSLWYACSYDRIINTLNTSDYIQVGTPNATNVIQISDVQCQCNTENRLFTLIINIKYNTLR